MSALICSLISFLFSLVISILSNYGQKTLDQTESVYTDLPLNSVFPSLSFNSNNEYLPGTSNLDYLKEYKLQYKNYSAQWVEDAGGSGGGTQLYRHQLTLSKPGQGGATDTFIVDIATLSNTPITEIQNMYGSVYYLVHSGTIIINLSDPTTNDMVLYQSFDSGNGFIPMKLTFGQSAAVRWIDADTTIGVDDVVTPL